MYVFMYANRLEIAALLGLPLAQEVVLQHNILEKYQPSHLQGSQLP